MLLPGGGTMKTLRKTLVALAVFVLAARLEAGTQGRVTGKVTDSAGNPIEGVTITVTTAAIKNFKVPVKTDKNGQYGLIVNDATLKYHMRFEKEGFNPGDRDEKFSIGDVKIVTGVEKGVPTVAFEFKFVVMEKFCVA